MNKILIFLIMIIISYSSSINIVNAKIRPVPPISKVSSGFMKIISSYNKDIRLIKAKSNFSKITEIHNVKIKNGIMDMFQVPFLTIPANGFTELKAGSYHFMFIDLIKPLKVKEIKSIKLYFDNGVKKIIPIEVKR